MGYKIGYVAGRVGVPSPNMQNEKLLEHGVLAKDIYIDLDECLGSLRTGDDLYIYTTAILGRNRLNSTFQAVTRMDSVNIFSIKTSTEYPCDDTGIHTLAEAWDELENVTKKQVAEAGRQLGGRKPTFVWKAKAEIIKSRNEGVPIKELSELHNCSEATIRRILQ